MFFTKPTYTPLNLDEEVPAPGAPAGVGEVFRSQEEAADNARRWYSFDENRKTVFQDHRKKIKELTGEDMPFGEDSSGILPSMKFQVTPDKEVNLYKDWHDYQREGGTLGFRSFYWSRYENSYRERLEYLAQKYPEHAEAIRPSALSFESQARQVSLDAERRAQEVWDRSKPGVGD